MKEKDIHTVENERKSKEDFQVIHFFIVNNYVRAYDISAWLTVTILGQILNLDDFKKLTIVHCAYKDKKDDTNLFVGFPRKKQDDYLSKDLAPEALDAEHYIVRLDAKYLKEKDVEQILKDYNEWKSKIPVTTFDSNEKRTNSRYPMKPGMMHEILSFQIQAKSPNDAVAFIQHLKEEVIKELISYND